MKTINNWPTKKYKIIYADSPWSYNDKMSGHSFSLDHEYETQDLEWIKNLPVKDIADKDSVLFMWAVSPMLPEAIEVMKCWGYSYKTLAFCWNKLSKDGKWIHNLGRWTMGNVELCLLGVKGHPKRICTNVKQLVVALRGRHSAKPDVVRERIVELMGDLPRIELFARGDKEVDMLGYSKFKNWDTWGNGIVEKREDGNVCE
jgi:site-specific DNA-methyltransferase (adenine-specific)